jgi:hypothetical protein
MGARPVKAGPVSSRLRNCGSFQVNGATIRKRVWYSLRYSSILGPAAPQGLGIRSAQGAASLRIEPPTVAR